MSLWIIISFVILSILCIYSVVKLNKEKKKPYAKAALGSYIFFAIVFLAIWIFDIHVPSIVLFLSIVTILGTDFFGHYLGLYVSSKTFDRYLHAFGSFALSLLTYFILIDFLETGESRIFQAILTFLLGNTLGVIFELFEFSHDENKKYEPKTQKGLKDTDMDMLFNIIGSVLAGVLIFFWVR